MRSSKLITNKEIAKYKGKQGWRERGEDEGYTCSVCYTLMSIDEMCEPTPYCVTCAATVLPQLIERIEAQNKLIAALRKK